MDELKNHLSLLFTSKRYMEIAYNLLVYIKKRSREKNPYKSIEWRKYCLENKIPYPTFYQVVRKLRKYGLIVKEGGHHDGIYRLGTTEALCKILDREWTEFLNA